MDSFSYGFSSKWHWGGTYVWWGSGGLSESCIPLQLALPVPLAVPQCRVPPQGGQCPSLAAPGGRGGEERGSVTLACLLPKLMQPPAFQGMLGLSWGVRLGFLCFQRQQGRRAEFISWWCFTGKFTCTLGKTALQGTCVPQPRVPAWAGGHTPKDEGMGKEVTAKNSLPFCAELTWAKINKTTSNTKPGTCLGKHHLAKSCEKEQSSSWCIVTLYYSFYRLWTCVIG